MCLHSAISVAVSATHKFSPGLLSKFLLYPLSCSLTITLNPLTSDFLHRMNYMGSFVLGLNIILSPVNVFVRDRSVPTVVKGIYIIIEASTSEFNATISVCLSVCLSRMSCRIYAIISIFA